MPTRSRPLWPLLTAALIGLPVLYVASFGPACWIVDRGWIPPESLILMGAYDPIFAISEKLPEPLSSALLHWATLGSDSTVEEAKWMGLDQWF